MRLTNMTSSTTKFAVILPIAAMLVITGCAKKKPLPDNAAQLGLNNATAPGTTQDFTVNVGDRVFFTTDSSTLTATARQTLDKQSVWLNKYSQFGITVEGHADERGTREYNLALGARRAAATKDYLVSRGVSRGRIKTISFGKERPVEVCNDISCWSKNRRAITILGGGNS